MIEVNAELIVVNNGSTDNTAEIIENFQQNSPFPIINVLEPKAGLSNARNAGIIASSGRVIAFTDDDCYPQPDLLREATAAFDTNRFSYCGGRILLYDNTDAKFACNYKEVFKLIPPFSFLRAGEIQGANMVIKRDLIEKIGLFDPMLGAGTKFRCEDIEYCARASLAGYWGAHVPSLVVYHHHGRKPGPEIENLKLENDYARGAYYAKFILKGKINYLSGWIETTISGRENISVRKELKGAIDYTLERMKKNCI
jgi:glycosyltransferase involved in cell wall biosynthesis